MRPAESGWLSSELAIGIRRVKGVKRLGRKIGNWLTGNQAQELLNAVSQNTLRGHEKTAAVIGLLLGCGVRRSEAVNLRVDQLQLRENHWVIVDMVKKEPDDCERYLCQFDVKALLDDWLRES